MIIGLFETHIEVHDLDISIDFYQKLGLTLGVRLEHAAFMYIGEKKEQMLGLWLRPVNQTISKRHFAFRVALEDLQKSKERLEAMGAKVIGSQGKGTDEPIVQRWMPAASVYFEDPDGNKLELIALLSGSPIEMPFVPYLSEWYANGGEKEESK